ncbi:hypothetical protein F4604DRAFT_1046941 [Suillus subluteus]|nr:hypothetical protein F4604DRAFT_1046941 [Suillus subluteus]
MRSIIGSGRCRAPKPCAIWKLHANPTAQSLTHGLQICLLLPRANPPPMVRCHLHQTLALQISPKLCENILISGRSHPRWSPLQELDDVSRRSSPSPYDFYIPSESSPIHDPPRSPSVPSSVSEFDSEDESDVAPSLQALRRIHTSGSQLSWTQRPLIPTISRPGSASGSSDSESWSDASASDGVDGSDGSDWDMMSEPERSS